MVSRLTIVKKIFFTAILLSTLLPCNVFAITTIPKSKYEIIATFPNTHYITQGGIVTKDYYVYTDCGVESAQMRASTAATRHCTNADYNILHIVDRYTCKNKSVKFDLGYISGISTKWGTNYISFYNGRDNKRSCMKLKGDSAVKVSDSNCYFATGVSTPGNSTPQGLATYYNGYLFKVAGRTYEEHPIAVFRNKDQKLVANYKLAERIAEPEQISIDGNTGEVYLAYNQGHKIGKKISRTLFIRVDSSVFKKYTGKNKTTTTPTCKGFDKPVKNSHSDTPTTKPSSSKPSSSKPSSSKPSSSKPSSSSSSSSQDSTTSQSTYDGTVDTVFFGEIKDDGSGCGVFTILNTIVDILSIGVGVLGVIAISIAGIQYLTSAGNEEQARKSRHRIFQIIIGLAVYAVMYAGVNWLTPGGKLNTGSECKTANYPKDLISKKTLI